MTRHWSAMALLLLAGCGDSPTVEAENASVAEVARKVERAGGGKVMRFHPGKWQSSVTIEDLSAPGMPPQAMQGMREAMAASRFEHCLTSAEAEKPSEDFFAGERGGNCTYDRFSMGDGKIDAVMRCGGDDGRQMIAMQGTYGPDTYAMRMTTDMAGRDGGVGAMTMTMRIDAKRIGDCDQPRG